MVAMPVGCERRGHINTARTTYGSSNEPAHSSRPPRPSPWLVGRRTPSQRPPLHYDLVAEPAPGRRGRPTRGLDPRHGDQGDTQVADLDQQSVQLRLIHDRAGDGGGAVGLTGDREPAEPAGPVVVEVA